MSIHENKRRFIKLALASAAGLSLYPYGKARGAGFSADVIVIGAGMSGLAAAKDLQSKGKKVILLEAQNAIGGRTVTDRSLGLPLDLGASWIHGVNKNPIAALASTLNLATSPTNYDAIQRYDYDGREITDTEDTLVDKNYSTLMSAVSKAQRAAKTDQSLGVTISSITATKTYTPFEQRAIAYSVNTEIEHDYAADVSVMSLKYWDQDSDFGGQDVLITQGYDQITSYLASGLDIRLSTIVTEINYAKTTVNVMTSNGTYAAPKVIITTPLGVLKKGVIKFTPSLPTSYTSAISRLGMGLLNKLYLRFPYKFWNNQEQLLGYIGLEKGRWAEWYDLQHVTNQPILLGFNAASFAATAEAYTDQQTVASAMSVLRTIYGATTPDPLGYKMTRWGKNSWSFGSYSYVALGSSPSDCDVFTKSINSRLYFAGEHTNKAYIGTVHGAYLSGLRASGQI
ncbi:MAG: FAD-dependent oxidoreductase [Gammaproteobacteria bacterium]|nr:FAD-dependent oxidoreductase [Gammaproteobacteria bacterium]NBT45480.1 FAD-dependent oxidoreductase [Gammaproteobacteria bacterium]NBY23530.1 FAD-dependent oxidoreductase [Gammaproteobacteria bacterium]NDE34553.1 FAD-dependent oxidoreductase [Gammaproteobacteria bacterium]NDE56568.1 FAD-dependent oxidoreductase [Gammaproteobacteria bacterium]